MLAMALPVLFLVFAPLCLAVPAHSFTAYDAALQVRQAGNSSASLQIDLGYDIYEGFSNASTGLNVWHGIRYAAPPIGSNRWQAPQAPTINRSSVISADTYAPYCPQNPGASGKTEPAPGTDPSEDCLFLNVYSPNNATGLLPVLVLIHGGGYGEGNGRLDFSSIINTNGNNFIGVSIQYRLGAFGFLASDEVYRNGVVNAGLLDQHFALQWVQSYISLFGGNASQVTISGQSAGGGSVMLQDMAYGGTLGNQLFENTISASPYLPPQYEYKDWIPSQSYYAFANAVGCAATTAYGNGGTVFQCLVSKDTAILQNASATISQSGIYGTWAFVPVTDNSFVQTTPSQQLLQKRVNGRNALIGNNADEGPAFTPNITTEAGLVSWLQQKFPLFTNDDIAKILLWYPSTNGTSIGTLFATSGSNGPTALNQSDAGTGQQQRADNIWAETTIICPSYWLAEAYGDRGRTSYKYQYSVPVALHGSDLSAYFGPPTPNQGSDFSQAFMKIWGNFITLSNPSISAEYANGESSNSSTASNPATTWPPFRIDAPYQIDLNQTGGTATSIEVLPGINVTEYVAPGLTNDFSLVDAYTWEGGRGYRCDFWRSMAAIIPE